MTDQTSPGESPTPLRYTGTITDIRTLQRKDGTGTYQMFKIISAAHKNAPNFMIDKVPDAIAEGMSVEVMAIAKRYAFQGSGGKTRFSYSRSVQVIRQI